MTLTGNAGISFDITEDDVTTATGEVTQVHSVPIAIGELTISASGIVYSISGSVGTTAFDLNLNAIDNQSGTGYSTSVIRNNAGDFTSLQQIVIYNTHASNGLIIGSPAANSLFTWGATNDTFTIPAGGSMTITYSTALTVGSNGKINIVGSAASTTFLVYILGA